VKSIPLHTARVVLMVSAWSPWCNEFPNNCQSSPHLGTVCSCPNPWSHGPDTLVLGIAPPVHPRPSRTLHSPEPLQRSQVLIEALNDEDTTYRLPMLMETVSFRRVGRQLRLHAGAWAPRPAPFRHWCAQLGRLGPAIRPQLSHL